MPFLDRQEMVAVSGWSRAAVYETVQKLEAGGFCPVPQEGPVKEREGPKVSFKRSSFPQEDQEFTDLNPRFCT